jgi:hypothetical protein
MAAPQPNASNPSNPSVESANESELSSPRSSSDSRASHSRTTSINIPRLSADSPHRQSYSESRRVPPSPHSRRQASLTHNAIQSLIDRPTPRGPPDPAFAGRDWGQISIGELVSPDDLAFVEEDAGIEEATEVPSSSTFTWLTRCMALPIPLPLTNPGVELDSDSASPACGFNSSKGRR